MSIRIAISIGDYNGIGPEVVLKGLVKFRRDGITPLVLGSDKIIERYLSCLEEPVHYHSASSFDEVREGAINVLNCLDSKEIRIRPGTVSEGAGLCAMRAVEKGIELCTNGGAGALVTAPISKEAVNRAGYAIPGHTEFLAEKTGTDDVVMLLVNKGLRVGLISTHIPLREVAPQVTRERILRKAGILNKSLDEDFGIQEPRLAVLGINPHAGDGGALGSEEIDIIAPAIRYLRESGVQADGPFPADGFFGNRNYKNFDAVLAMYHDQGLIPFKALSFGAGVNFTAGLPIVRTSPDHGTAFDIAGRGKADPGSFLQALELATILTEKREKKKTV